MKYSNNFNHFSKDKYGKKPKLLLKNSVKKADVFFAKKHNKPFFFRLKKSLCY